MSCYEILPSGKRIYTDASNAVQQDGLLLAAFVAAKSGSLAVEFGCGSGAVGFNLAERAGHVLMVDINPTAIELAAKTAAEGGFCNIELLCADIRDWRTEIKYDIVVCNPPYFTDGPVSAVGGRARARHSLCMTFDDAASAAARALKQGGSFYVCCPPARLAGLFYSLKGQRLEPKTLSLVRNAAGRRWLALVRSSYCGGEGLTITDDILSEV